MSNYILSMNPPADCTPEEVEQAIQYFVSLPLEELRRRQAIVELQREQVLSCGTMRSSKEAYRQLDASAEHLRQAIDRKEFPQ